jgi:hypothetical protein
MFLHVVPAIAAEFGEQPEAKLSMPRHLRANLKPQKRAKELQDQDLSTKIN